MQNFIEIACVVFEKIEKSRKETVFGQFGTIYGQVAGLTGLGLLFKPNSQGSVQMRKSCPNFFKIVSRVQEKMEFFISKH